MENKKINKEEWRALIWLNELFRRYYENQATEKEKQIVESWNPEKESKPDIRFLKNDKETEIMWQRIATQLGIQHTFPTSKRTFFATTFRKYAAVGIILLTVGTAFYFTKTTKEQSTIQSNLIVKEYFQSGAGERKKMTLPDGSVVYLNSDTKLAVAPALFNKEKREIWLEEGEAFFEVAKNPEKPFIIHNQHLETTVKGTSFNVKAYKELDQTSVSVRSGKVEVRNNNILIAELTKNRQIIYNKRSGKTELGDTHWEDAAGWVEGRLVFRQAGGKEIKLRLQQIYNVHLEIKDNALNEKETVLNSSFSSEASLKEVLDVISLMADVHYKIINPQEVIIYK